MAIASILRLAGFVLCAGLVYFIYKLFSARTFSVPGPISARFSRLRFLRTTISGDFEKDNFQLHQKYGKIVRIAPGVYSIDDPEAIDAIYGLHARFAKSKWYSTFQQPGLPNLFSETDNAQHAVQRKKFHRAYTVSAMTSYESYVDDCIKILMQRLTAKAESKESFDLNWWFQCFTLDVITLITFSERFGFLEKGQDVINVMRSLQDNAVVTTTLSVYPAVWRPLFNFFMLVGKLGLVEANANVYIGNLEEQKWKEYEKSLQSGAADPKPDDPSKPKDFLMKFMESYRNEDQGFTKEDAIVGLSTNIVAGSDTTNITLSAIFYFLSKNPDKLSILRQELSSAESAGKISSSYPMTFPQSQSLEYLQAVIKESLRLWPSFSRPFLRVVPAGGAFIAGQYFEAGEEVGINPWVAHRNREVFGEDAGEFRPERWLKKEKEGDGERLSRLEHYWIPFGIGSRSCIGKNVSLMEVGKLVPEIVRRWDFELDSQLLERGPESRNLSFLAFKSLTVRARDVGGY